MQQETAVRQANDDTNHIF